jgi:hypothetical protein
MTIRFGDITFEQPKRLRTAVSGRGPGIYCVCVADPAPDAQTFRPMYFGATAEFAELALRSHPLYNEWLAHAGSAKLAVALVRLQEFSAEQRELFVAQLALRYRTPFNKFSPPPDVKFVESSPNADPTQALLSQEKAYA